MIEVRRIRPEEYADAGEVTASAWEPAGTRENEASSSFRNRVADVAGRDSVAKVFVAIEGGNILGSVTLEMGDRVGDEKFSTPLPLDEAHVRVLGVAPAVQRRGVAKMLMNYCEDVARRDGKTRLTLNTSVNNMSAQSFYEAIGYKRQEDLELEDGSKLCQYELKLR